MSASLLQHAVKRLDSDELCQLSDWAGYVILVVNTASACGFTGQYRGLVELFERYRSQRFVILGFPCNDFGQQEQGSDATIAQFCEQNYRVSFPLFAKISVKGREAHPFFQGLIEKTRSKPRWNFHKYLIGRDGETVKSFSALTFPRSRRLKHAIERMLEDPVQE